MDELGSTPLNRNRRKNRIGRRRALKTPIVIEGLEGETDVTCYVEEDLAGFTQVIGYRNAYGTERLTFKFQSALTEPAHEYDSSNEAGNTMSRDRKIWTHVGETRTGSSDEVRGRAFVTTEIRRGGSRVRYMVSGEYPFSDPYEKCVDIPFT